MRKFTQTTLIFLLISSLATVCEATVTTVTNTGLSFTPADITITAGDTVDWQIGIIHNVVEVSETTWNANGTTSNTGFELPFGGGQVVLTTPGTYYYVCQPHAAASMKGRVVVMEEVLAERFVAFLGGANEAPQRFSPGRGQVVAELDGSTLTVSGSFSNLLSPFDPTVAGGSHIHMGIAGTNGGVLFVLTPVLDANLRGGQFLSGDNTFVLDTDQLDALRGQRTYINIHTTFYQSGEIRGQLVPESESYFGSNLLGVYQTPAVTTNGAGTIVAQLEGDQLTISGSFSELDSDIDTSILGGIHMHVGFAGANGPVAFPLRVALSSDLRSGIIDPAVNIYTLTFPQVIRLQARGLYINLHTLDHQGGAIRGQLRGPAHTVYRAYLNGMNQNPPIVTSAQGMLIAEHIDSNLVISGSYAGLESPMDTNIVGGAHIHVASAGSNGPVLTPISATFPRRLAVRYFLFSNELIYYRRSNRKCTRIQTTLCQYPFRRKSGW